MMSDFDFSSRRSVIVCKNGCVASSCPLASQVGLDILKAGGNAADAAVAVAACLNVTEPMSTGLGGDAFCLFYDSHSKTVKGLNGSGRSSSSLTYDRVKGQGFCQGRPIPATHGLAVTVPGAAAAWVDTVHNFGSGKLSMGEILSPAINMAEGGFPVQEIAAYFWNEGSHLLLNPSNRHGKDMLLNGKAPRHGQMMKNTNLAATLKKLSVDGKKGFYEGCIAKAIVDTITSHGGVMTSADLASHTSTMVDPIYTDYKSQRLWEIPPNGQGMVALIALNILEGIDMKGMGHNSNAYIHHLIESLRLAFADGLRHCSDPEHSDIPLTHLLSKEYAAQLRKQIKTDGVIPSCDLNIGNLKETLPGTDTVYFSVVDKQGNACSFINSNYMGFGTGLVPEGCGFTLQNRGCGFSLDPSHPNAIGAGRRPYHTIIPAMLTNVDTGDLLMSYGVMGGFMQPQGHVQVLLNMLEFGCNPQQALDKPRVCLPDPYLKDTVCIEEGISEDVLPNLTSLGHSDVRIVSGMKRSSVFGRGQAIAAGDWWCSSSHSHRDNDDDGDILRPRPMYWAGSDPRADGQVAAY